MLADASPAAPSPLSLLLLPDPGRLLLLAAGAGRLLLLAGPRGGSGGAPARCDSAEEEVRWSLGPEPGLPAEAELVLPEGVAR